MQSKIYQYLPAEAKSIRQAVFVEEQGFQNEFDDLDKKALHLILFDEEKPVATSRFYWDGEKKSFITGRIAVRKEYRGLHLGARLLAVTENVIREKKGKRIMLAAQVRAQEFYKKQGYVAIGEIFADEGCPHIWMEKNLEK